MGINLKDISDAIMTLLITGVLTYISFHEVKKAGRKKRAFRNGGIVQIAKILFYRVEEQYQKVPRIYSHGNISGKGFKYRIIT